MQQIAFDSQSASRIVLNNGSVLNLKEVSDVLALVYVMREDVEDVINKGQGYFSYKSKQILDLVILSLVLLLILNLVMQFAADQKCY